MIDNIFANQMSKVRIIEHSIGDGSEKLYIQHSNTWKFFFFFGCPTWLAES